MRLWRRSIAVGALVALIVSGMPVGAGARAQAAAAPVRVRIAVAAPLTAGAVGMGSGMQRGVHLAVDDYAARLAAKGVAVTVVDADDQGDPLTAVNVARTLVSDPLVLGVVGHLNSGCSIPAASVYAAARVTMISPISSNPYLTQLGLSNVFRTCATDNAQGPYAADTVVKNLGLKRAFVVDDSTPYGETLTSRFRKRFKSDGGTVVGYAKTSDRDADFDAVVTKIKAKRPTVVYYGGIYNAGALLADQLKDAGVDALFVGADGLFDQEFVNIAGASSARGAMATTIGRPVDQLPGGSGFARRYSAAFPGDEILPTDAYAYDAAAAILRALIAVAHDRGAGALVASGARSRVRAKVASGRFTGITGKVAFDSDGDTKYPAVSAWRVAGGRWKPCARIGKPALKGTKRKGRTVTVSGSLAPRHASGTKAVTLRFSRKSGTKWLLVKTVKATVKKSGTFSRYSTRFRLPRKGAWRVIASHADASHPYMRAVTTRFTVK